MKLAKEKLNIVKKEEWSSRCKKCPSVRTKLLAAGTYY
jgi:hypothetical protein